MTQPKWNTQTGTLGAFPAGVLLTVNLSADAIAPATYVTYQLLSGELPPGVTLDDEGLLSGVPTLNTFNQDHSFVVRVTDNLSSVRDRAFTIQISGVVTPQLTTPPGSILYTQDSIWVDMPIEYSNPKSTNNVLFLIKEGTLPPGLSMTDNGIIRGYPSPPLIDTTLNSIVTLAAESFSASSSIVCASTNGFTVNRPVVFSGYNSFGGVTPGITYYIKSILSTTAFTISETQEGPTKTTTDEVGSMTVTLPITTVGAPTIRTYSFIVDLSSALGGDSGTYSITVVNQTLPTSSGGPGKTPNTRAPTILNTRPEQTATVDTDEYYGYYITEASGYGLTGKIGTVQSGDYFSFKVLGHDFDDDILAYSFAGLPLGLVGDSTTGWITGTPTVPSGISNFSFSVSASKVVKPNITSDSFVFSVIISDGIDEVITWTTPNNLGTISNGTLSTLSVLATAEVPLKYRIVSGQIPPNLVMLSTGEITGYVAYQPTEEFLARGQTVWNFSVEAFSENYSIITSTKSFTLTVKQDYPRPTETVYIKATPSITDRHLIASLLDDVTLIPTESLYRPDDIYFGKASSVIYDHAYGIFASDINEYLAAIVTNHYWRNLTLGELKTAVAKNATGDIIYEVVYSEVIDNLASTKNLDKDSVLWSRPIDLSLGPWYTSITDIYTSYDFDMTYYTSLTSGRVRTLYPNSMNNMRNKLSQVVGRSYDYRLLPLWMTSQQQNGSTTGFVQAWVICYTLPGQAETIKNNIMTNWPHTLNQVDFKIDRFIVDKSNTYNYDKNLSPPAWTGLPSASPTPDPIDTEDFYVLFPRRGILPTSSQD